MRTPTLVMGRLKPDVAKALRLTLSQVYTGEWIEESSFSGTDIRLIDLSYLPHPPLTQQEWVVLIAAAGGARRMYEELESNGQVRRIKYKRARG
jgi:hypothetical protein